MTAHSESRATTACKRSQSPWRPNVPISKRKRWGSRSIRALRRDTSAARQEDRMTHATGAAYKSPLHKMTQTTPTCLWNDSASISELTYSIEHGAVGATCNPVIVHGILKKEMSFWKGRIQELIKELPTATEDEIAWQLVREISIRAAALLKPIFDAQHGRNG